MHIEPMYGDAGCHKAVVHVAEDVYLLGCYLQTYVNTGGRSMLQVYISNLYTSYLVQLYLYLL